MSVATKLTCGHPAESTDSIQWCDRCGCEQPLAAPAPAPAPRPTRAEIAARFADAEVLTGYEVLRRDPLADPDADLLLGDVTSHRSTRGILWRALSPTGDAAMFRRRRDAIGWLRHLADQREVSVR